MLISLRGISDFGLEGRELNPYKLKEFKRNPFISLNSFLSYEYLRVKIFNETK